MSFAFLAYCLYILYSLFLFSSSPSLGFPSSSRRLHDMRQGRERHVPWLQKWCSEQSRLLFSTEYYCSLCNSMRSLRKGEKSNACVKFTSIAMDCRRCRGHKWYLARMNYYLLKGDVLRSLFLTVRQEVGHLIHHIPQLYEAPQILWKLARLDAHHSTYELSSILQSVESGIFSHQGVYKHQGMVLSWN